MKDDTKIYGIVVGHEKITFALDGFQCVFINADIETKKPEIISHNHGFILAKTTDRKYIYIHSGQDLKIWNQLTLNTWLYFISQKSDIETYKAIAFRGGILDKLFFNSDIEFDYDTPMETRVKHKDDRMVYSLSNEKIKGNISVRSNTSLSVSAEKGSSIGTTGTELEISFEEEKDIQTFSEVFGYILSMCRFMTYRRNVKFEKVFLRKKSSYHPEANEEIASCYIRYDNTNNTEKSIHSCITFNALGECIEKLLDSIVNNKPKKPSFNIGFIPENDNDVNVITSMKVREVCSSLESEMELMKIKVQQEKEFDNLVDNLKLMVKEHRDGDCPLTDDKVYDYILGTLKHLTGALADRIEKCFMDNQPILGEWLNKRKIDEIVNYRNIITHGNYMQLNAELAETTDVLIKLVYCCVLKRTGMEDDQIRNLFKRRIIS